MLKDDPELTVEQELEQERYAAWRVEVADRLNSANRWSESINFRECGHLWGNFQVLTCADDPGHQARALPFTCHLRYCPECEHRNQARQVAKYTGALKAIADEGSRDEQSWRLKKITITTPYRLDDPHAPELFEEAWQAFERFQQSIMQELLQHEMKANELHSRRLNYKQHGYGALVNAEFGETGRHLHFHITAYCPFMPKDMITRNWLMASGGTCEVNDVRKVDYADVEDSIRETVKYVTKFSNLPPELVVNLADVLDGQHRMRVYGVFRGAKAEKPEPCACDVCASKLTIMRVTGYFEYVLAHNIEPDTLIASAGSLILLDLKRGNFVGKDGEKLARSDIPDTPEQLDLPVFDELKPTKKPFVYS